MSATETAAVAVARGTVVPLTAEERAELARCEGVVQRGLAAMIEAGQALKRIREERLYREQFGTFEEYCHVKFGMTARRVRQIWSAGAVVHHLAVGPQSSPDGPQGGAPGGAAICFPLPTTESQARPLVGLPAAVQRQVWAEAVRTAPGGKVTGAHVQAVLAGLASARRTGQSSPDGADLKSDISNLKATPVAPPPGGKEERLRVAAEAAIARTRELMDAIGTADSVAAAEVATALEKLEQFTEHLTSKRMRANE
ncbi:MAG: hypothetical protein AB1705_15390 [Verrucomicrobiota bacterium]